MPSITVKDGTSIYYKDWGAGQPGAFSHGWPLNADAWDDQAFFVASNGYRAVAHDRRGHGRSGQAWDGHDMDHYADDLAELIERLDLRDAVLVGHSTGGGEVVRYLGRHGTARVAKAVLVGAVPPLMLKTVANPGGQPIEAFDAIREGVRTDRSQFYQDLSAPFYGANRPVDRVPGTAGRVLGDEHARGSARRLRLRQGVLGDRPDRGPEEDRRPGAAGARGRRPDRPVRGLVQAVGRADPGRHPQG